MAVTYQCTYEYVDGSTITFITNDMKVRIVRPLLKVHTMGDGTRKVSDPNVGDYLEITCTSIITGNTMDTLHSVQTGSITYSGAYPRLTVIYWDGDSTETNYEVALTELEAQDLGNYWRVSLTFTGKDQ